MAAAAEAVLFLLHHHLAFFGLRISPSVSVPSPRRRSAGEVALLAVVVVAALLTATTHAASATIESRPADALRSEVDELRLRVLHLGEAPLALALSPFPPRQSAVSCALFGVLAIS